MLCDVFFRTSVGSEKPLTTNGERSSRQISRTTDIAPSTNARNPNVADIPDIDDKRNKLTKIGRVSKIDVRFFLSSHISIVVLNNILGSWKIILLCKGWLAF